MTSENKRDLPPPFPPPPLLFPFLAVELAKGSGHDSGRNKKRPTSIVTQPTDRYFENNRFGLIEARPVHYYAGNSLIFTGIELILIYISPIGQYDLNDITHKLWAIIPFPQSISIRIVQQIFFSLSLLHFSIKSEF